MIFVTVGSRNYQFNRLFERLDELFEKGMLSERVFAQIGTSTYYPKHYEYKDYLTEEEFDSLINDSDIVIAHGGTGSIMRALNAGKKTILVTRLKKYGEHINDHQIQNNIAFSSYGFALMTGLELENLGDCIKLIHEGNDDLKPWNNKNPMSIINMIDGLIQEKWNGLC